MLEMIVYFLSVSLNSNLDPDLDLCRHYSPEYLMKIHLTDRWLTRFRETGNIMDMEIAGLLA